ncbi:putative reverse transcriptase domain-containing protein [Tanacetum coccineum]
MSDSEDSTVTYTAISSPFGGMSDIGSPGVDGQPVMPKDPYSYVVAAFQAPPSPDYVPGPEEPKQAPLSPEFVPEPVYLEFMPPKDEVLPTEEQPLSDAMVTTRRNSDEDVPNFEAMINAAVAKALPNLTAALRTQITNDIRNGAGLQVVVTRLVRLNLEGDACAGGKLIWYQVGVMLLPLLDQLDERILGSKWRGLPSWIVLLELLLEMLGKLGTFQVGLTEVGFGRIVNNGLHDVAQVAAVARNIELLHESGNSNKRDNNGEGLSPREAEAEYAQAIFARLLLLQGVLMLRGSRDQAAKTSGTVTGTLYIDDRTVFVLFDTGATHSIISTIFAKNS